jgi:hypothetical protein
MTVPVLGAAVDPPRGEQNKNKGKKTISNHKFLEV